MKNLGHILHSDMASGAYANLRDRFGTSLRDSLRINPLINLCLSISSSLYTHIGHFPNKKA